MRVIFAKLNLLIKKNILCEQEFLVHRVLTSIYCIIIILLHYRAYAQASKYIYVDERDMNVSIDYLRTQLRHREIHCYRNVGRMAHRAMQVNLCVKLMHLGSHFCISRNIMSFRALQGLFDSQ